MSALPLYILLYVIKSRYITVLSIEEAKQSCIWMVVYECCLPEDSRCTFSYLSWLFPIGHLTHLGSSICGGAGKMGDKLRALFRTNEKTWWAAHHYHVFAMLMWGLRKSSLLSKDYQITAWQLQWDNTSGPDNGRGLLSERGKSKWEIMRTPKLVLGLRVSRGKRRAMSYITQGTTVTLDSHSLYRIWFSENQHKKVLSHVKKKKKSHLD